MHILVKAISDDELDVLGAPYGGPWGGRDRDGEYFDAATNFHADKIPLPPVVYYHGREGEAALFLGKTIKRWTDAAGEWFRVKLDMTIDKAKELVEKARQGLVAASSGAVPAVARKDEATGHITDWLIGELSLFETDTGKRPSNSYALAMPAMKALYEKAGMEVPDFSANENPEALPGGQAVVEESAPTQPIEIQGDNEMTPEELAKFLDERDAAKAAAQKAAQEAEDRIAAEVKARTEKAIAEKEAEFAKAHRLPLGGAPVVAKFGDLWKYDDLTAHETAAVAAYQIACGKRPGQSLVKAIMQKMADEKVPHMQKSVSKTAAATGIDVGQWQKSDEVFHTTTGGEAADWVGTAYSNMLWANVRAPQNALGRVPEVIVPQGYSSQYFPVEGSDPTLYTVAQSEDTSSNNVATRHTVGKITANNKQLTLGTLGGMVYVSYEAEEDSIVDAMRQNSDQLAMAMAEGAEALFFDGDSTSGSANINDRDGTGAATNWYIAADGVRKYCLITNTGQARSAAGSLAASDFSATMKLLGTVGLAADPSKSAFFVTPGVWWKLLNLPEVLTRDVNSAATIESGRVAAMYGIPLFPTWFMCKAQASRQADEEGFVDTTDADNDYGTIAIVRFDQWKFAHKTLVRLESTREPKAGVTCITASSRLGFGARNTTDAAALSYYVGI